MKKFFVVHVLVAAVAIHSFGQDKGKIDSLNSVLAGNLADSTRVKTLMNLAGEHYLSSPDLAIKDCKASLELAEKIKLDEGIGEAQGWLAFLYEQQGEIDSALSYYNKALVIAIKTGSKKSEASILNNIAAIYNDRGRVDEALKYHHRALAIREAAKDTEGMSSSYNNIAFIYQTQGKIPDALDYFSKALKISEQVKDKDGEATALENIGFIYKEQKQYESAKEFFFKSLAVHESIHDKYGTGYSLNAIGGLYEEMGNPDSALYYFNRALKLRSEIADKQGIAYTLKNIGNVYVKLNKPEEAKQSFRKSLEAFESLGDKRGISIVTNLYGASVLDGGNYEEGRTYLEQSLRLAKELGFPADIRNAAGNLQRLFRKKSQWKEALLMNDLFIQMRDSVENDINKKASLKNQAWYEYEKKEALLKSEQEKKNAIASAELKKQKLIRNSASGGLVIVVLFLAVVFRQRNKISAEKKRSDELLLNILPAETAEELKTTGSAKAKSFDLVTVLFSDFRNFTQAAEKLSPEELVSEINLCYSEFDKIIGRHGIEKIKTIGDAYMCAGGLPVTNSTHPIDVVKAGLEMQDFIAKHKSEREKTGQPFFELRIGVHTGPVVAGIVGIKKFAYDIWGDTVNTASRMESSGEAGKVNISGTTYDLIKDRFVCEYRGKVKAKNKGEIDMYFIIRSLGEG
jgi:adenylate cyclase